MNRDVYCNMRLISKCTYCKVTILILLHKLPDKSVYLIISFSNFSTNTYVVGTQKNRLNETVL